VTGRQEPARAAEDEGDPDRVSLFRFRGRRERSRQGAKELTRTTVFFETLPSRGSIR
jgi:hypothetical protein